MVLGILALAATVITTLVSIIVLGVLLLAGGGMLIISAFSAHGWGAVLLRVVPAILALLAGSYLIVHSARGAIALTLVMAWYFIISGLFRLGEAVVERSEQWGWLVASGIVSIILGILLLAHWPITGLFAIGIFIGFDLLLFGISLIVASVTAKRSAPPTRAASPAL